MKTIKLLIFAAIFSVSTTASAQLTKSELRTLLEQFCVEHYNTCFEPRQYVEGTLVVTSVDVDEANNKIRVRGTHTCRGQYIPLVGRRTYTNREFKAEVIPANMGVKIKFWRWYESDPGQNNAHWEGPCEKTILPE